MRGEKERGDKERRRGDIRDKERRQDKKMRKRGDMRQDEEIRRHERR